MSVKSNGLPLRWQACKRVSIMAIRVGPMNRPKKPKAIKPPKTPRIVSNIGKLPGNNTIMVAAGWTVLLSVVAHGVTANPIVKAIGRPSEEAPRNVRSPTTSR